MKQIKVMHLATESSWRGGENQIRLLIEGLSTESQIASYVACPTASLLRKRLPSSVNFVTIPTGLRLKTSAFLRLAKFCVHHQIDMLDAHTGHGHTLGLLTKWWLKRRYNTSIKLIVHRRVDNRPNSSWLNRKKYLSPLVDQYIAISEAIAGVLEAIGVSKQRITVVHSAVDGSVYHKLQKQQEKQALARSFGIDEQICFIGNASALSPQKGYETLLRALRLVKDNNSKFHCFIAGNGELRTELEDLREQLGLEYDITFLGFIDQIPHFLSALDVLCVPSQNEGLGTILLEGAHAGCALIGSNIGGIPEIIKNMQTGLLVEKGNYRQLADAILKMIQSPNFIRDLSQAAHSHVTEHFTPQAMVEQNLQVYHRVLKT